MTDDELRALERAVASSGSAAERLAYARALERVGRADDALAVLLPEASNPEVRRAFGRFPSWDRAASGVRGPRFLDVDGITREPRVRRHWLAPDSHYHSVSKPPAERQTTPIGLLANPLRFVAVTKNREDLRTYLSAVEPHAGIEEREWVLEDGARPVDLRGSEVIEPRLAGLVACDLVSLDALDREIIPRGRSSRPREAVIRSGLALVPDDRAKGRHVHELESPATARWLLQDRTDAGWGKLEQEPVVTQTRLFRVAVDDGPGPETGRVDVLDRATGRTLWKKPLALVMADDSGALLRLQRDLLVVDSGGRELWRWPHGEVVAISPQTVVLQDLTPASRDADLVFVERNTGRERGRVARLWVRAESVLVRDVLYAIVRELIPPAAYSRWRDEIVAISLEGRVLWRRPFEEAPVFALAPVSRRLLVMGARGNVVCLEEAPA